MKVLEATTNHLGNRGEDEDVAKEANRDFRLSRQKAPGRGNGGGVATSPSTLNFSASMSWKHPRTKQTAQEKLISGLVGMVPGEQVKTRL